MSKFVKEFREFISRGNVMDMAVGVIIGGAFTGIVTSLTDNIINPLITFLTGGGTEISGLVVMTGYQKTLATRKSCWQDDLHNLERHLPVI
jgi:large conductance mechanosensitive channel protein